MIVNNTHALTRIYTSAYIFEYECKCVHLLNVCVCACRNTNKNTYTRFIQWSPQVSATRIRAHIQHNDAFDSRRHLQHLPVNLYR